MCKYMTCASSKYVKTKAQACKMQQSVISILSSKSWNKTQTSYPLQGAPKAWAAFCFLGSYYYLLFMMLKVPDSLSEV